MHAAVVRSFEHASHYEDFDLPPHDDENAVVIHVLASGPSSSGPLQASGAHYADERVLPMIPGIDAVGLLPGGNKVYFVVMIRPLARWLSRSSPTGAVASLCPRTWTMRRSPQE